MWIVSNEVNIFTQSGCVKHWPQIGPHWTSAPQHSVQTYPQQQMRRKVQHRFRCFVFVRLDFARREEETLQVGFWSSAGLQEETETTASWGLPLSLWAFFCFVFCMEVLPHCTNSQCMKSFLQLSKWVCVWEKGTRCINTDSCIAPSGVSNILFLFLSLITTTGLHLSLIVSPDSRL